MLSGEGGVLMIQDEQTLRRTTAKNIAAYRKAHKDTQLDLARKLNYSDKSVSKWERGEGLPDVYILAQIAQLYGITVSNLIGEEEPPKEDREKDEPEDGGGTALFAEGGLVPLSGRGLSQKKTLPRPLYTEATLLAAMENCGKDITDGEARETVKDSGIGTPATRAAIITTLFKRNYVERSGKSILPTEKGLYLYESVKDMMVADAELTGTWERALARIEGRTLDPDSFMLSIREYTGKVTGEILRLKFPEPSSHAFTCPKCKAGNVVVKSKVAKCDREGCGLLVFRRFLNKELTDRHLEQLFSSGSTRLIKGFKGKKGCSFDAALTFDDSFNLKLSFPKPKGAKGK